MTGRDKGNTGSSLTRAWGPLPNFSADPLHEDAGFLRSVDERRPRIIRFDLAGECGEAGIQRHLIGDLPSPPPASRRPATRLASRTEEIARSTPTRPVWIITGVNGRLPRSAIAISLSPLASRERRCRPTFAAAMKAARASAMLPRPTSVSWAVCKATR